MNPFQSLLEYEEFVYTLPNQYPSIQSSTLVVAQRGAKVADIVGELTFVQGIRLVIHEHVTFYDGTITLRRYSYGAWRGDERLYWYDPQPHPNNPDLALNHPHHKHVPPDIKHNRIPAPELSFEQPNLPFLITEIEQHF